MKHGCYSWTKAVPYRKHCSLTGVFCMLLVIMLFSMFFTFRGVYYVPNVSVLQNDTDLQQLYLNRSYTCNCNVSSNKYVMALWYWEQLMMASNNLLSLAAYSKYLGARTVQPFIKHSEFFGLPITINFTGSSIKSRQSTLDLGIIYNMSTFQEMLCDKYSIPPLASFQDFLYKANRELTIVRIIFSHELSANRCSELMQAFKSSFKELTKLLNMEAKKHNIQKQFTIKRACCIHKKMNTLPSGLAAECGLNEDSFSVVFMQWRGYTDEQNDKFRLKIASFSNAIALSEVSNNNRYAATYPFSNAVLSNATAFYKDMADGKQLISIHFRTERIREACATQCFNEVCHLVDQLKTDYPDAKLKYFVDYNPFGSHSIKYQMYRVNSKYIHQKLFEQKNITPEYYRVEKYGGVPEQAFVALVEEAAIAKSDILILVGGGGFQAQIRHRFIEKENGSKLYSTSCNKATPPILEFNRTST